VCGEGGWVGVVGCLCVCVCVCVNARKPSPHSSAALCDSALPSLGGPRYPIRRVFSNPTCTAKLTDSTRLVCEK